ncbi:hypothetical protein [Cytophaga aurantiaca]|uniref:hypothetical protein n=1 Tax=Cytophaga aurantiaca TaxID=29530 RepID=UPI00035FAD83|nr:hypothetical protein [Cytophaga aurantiaca]
MQQFDIKSKLVEILKKQKSKRHHIALDIHLHNGNILLKSFRLYDFDKTTDVIKGMTMHEEYAYLREGRDPVYAYFNITEIKQLDSATSNYLFLSKPVNALV